MLVVDLDSRLCGVIEKIRKFIQITYWHLACVYHKGNSVEIYHQLLKKTQSIVVKDSGSHDVFFQKA